MVVGILGSPELAAGWIVAAGVIAITMRSIWRFVAARIVAAALLIGLCVVNVFLGGAFFLPAAAALFVVASLRRPWTDG